MKKVAIVVVAVLVLGALGGLAAVLFYNSNVEGGPGGAPVKVLIKPGSSGDEIAQELESAGVVGSALAFRIFLKLSGGGAGLRAGEYELRASMPYSEVVGELKKGPPVKYVKLTVPEGFTLAQTATRVGEQTHVTKEQFLAAATPATVRPGILPPGVETLEGFLYPTTYFVIEKESPEDLVRRMVAQFEKEVAPTSLERARDFNLSPYEILVLASLIEEEAKVDEERALISAVIHNRLRRGMKLEIDATVRYAVGKFAGEPFTQSDLAVNSPYNTRLHPGIPPTPIASPRAGSVQAALAPADSDALFYVLTADCRRHFFSASYDEFLREKARGCV